MVPNRRVHRPHEGPYDVYGQRRILALELWLHSDAQGLHSPHRAGGHARCGREAADAGRHVVRHADRRGHGGRGERGAARHRARPVPHAQLRVLRGHLRSLEPEGSPEQQVQRLGGDVHHSSGGRRVPPRRRRRARAPDDAGGQPPPHPLRAPVAVLLRGRLGCCHQLHLLPGHAADIGADHEDLEHRAECWPRHCRGPLLRRGAPLAANGWLCSGAPRFCRIQLLPALSRRSTLSGDERGHCEQPRVPLHQKAS
mmetsp:Transcript_112567/g.350882  ORF Transcript_112567/g.350882 Transcript_112567/m.350882 type:complete len:255 (+) Transcript_112567:657-1421(+)